jgi:hypothetical protein
MFVNLFNTTGSFRITRTKLCFVSDIHKDMGGRRNVSAGQSNSGKPVRSGSGHPSGLDDSAHAGRERIDTGSRSDPPRLALRRRGRQVGVPPAVTDGRTPPFGALALHGTDIELLPVSVADGDLNGLGDLLVSGKVLCRSRQTTGTPGRGSAGFSVGDTESRSERCRHIAEERKRADCEEDCSVGAADHAENAHRGAPSCGTEFSDEL